MWAKPCAAHSFLGPPKSLDGHKVSLSFCHFTALLPGLGPFLNELVLIPVEDSSTVFPQCQNLKIK